jgi:hypothetical protein
MLGKAEPVEVLKSTFNVTLMLCNPSILMPQSNAKSISSYFQVTYSGFPASSRDKSWWCNCSFDMWKKNIYTFWCNACPYLYRLVPIISGVYYFLFCYFTTVATIRRWSKTQAAAMSEAANKVVIPPAA